MFLKHVPTNDLIEVIDLTDVINPDSPTILARSHAGEMIQRPEHFLKEELVFPSGELLPRCWLDKDAQKHAAETRQAHSV
jgi:hypothetical protein